MRPIIVGIDPGTTTAYAAISFDFEVLEIKSKRNYAFSEMISDIYDAGNPIIVGSDKKDTPALIKEFSQKTGAKVHATRYDTKKKEKRYLVKDLGLYDEVRNAHETDALASAIYAYYDYAKLIKKIKDTKHEYLDKIFMLVISKEMSIARAIQELEEKPKEMIEQITRPVQIKKTPSKEEKEIQLLKRMVAKLRTEIIRLREENNSLKKIDIDKATKKIINFKENRALSLEENYRKLIKELESSGKTIVKLNEFIQGSGGKVLMKKLPNLGNIKADISKGDIIYVNNLSIVSEKLLERIKDKVKYIVYKEGKSRNLKDFILIPDKDLRIVEVERFAYVDNSAFKKAVKKASKNNIRDQEFIYSIINDYKRERLKDII